MADCSELLTFGNIYRPRILSTVAEKNAKGYGQLGRVRGSAEAFTVGGTRVGREGAVERVEVRLLSVVCIEHTPRGWKRTVATSRDSTLWKPRDGRQHALYAQIFRLTSPGYGPYCPSGDPGQQQF
jgi:hypothetical protein